MRAEECQQFWWGWLCSKEHRPPCRGFCPHSGRGCSHRRTLPAVPVLLFPTNWVSYCDWPRFILLEYNYTFTVLEFTPTFSWGQSRGLKYWWRGKVHLHRYCNWSHKHKIWQCRFRSIHIDCHSETRPARPRQTVKCSAAPANMSEKVIEWHS